MEDKARQKQTDWDRTQCSTVGKLSNTTHTLQFICICHDARAMIHGPDNDPQQHMGLFLLPGNPGETNIFMFIRMKRINGQYHSIDI